MINYPMTPQELKVVAWTGRVITLLAAVMLCLIGTLALSFS